MLSGTKTWLKQTVTVKPYSSLSNYAEPSYGTGTSVSCRVQQTNEKIIGNDDTIIHATARIIMDGNVSVSVKDKITLPDGEERPILKLSPIAGPNGTTYLKVLYV